MEHKRGPGNPFAGSQSRGEPSGGRRQEDEIEFLARELGGLTYATPAAQSISSSASTGSSRQPNYSPLSSSAAASGQLRLPSGNASPVLDGSATGTSGTPVDVRPLAGVPQLPSARLPSYAQNYSPMRAARAASVGRELDSPSKAVGPGSPAGIAHVRSASGDLRSVASRAGRSPRQAGGSFDASASLTSAASVGMQQQQRQRETEAALAAADVDGVPRPTVDAWFAEADATRSGLLASRDAVTFFQRTGLQPKVLSKIWNTVKAVSAEQQEGLNRAQFGMALRLVAVAQSGTPLTDELARTAVSAPAWAAAGHKPLPPPMLGPSLRRSMPSADKPSEAPKAPAHSKSYSEGAQTVNLADLRGRTGKNAFANLAAQQQVMAPAAQPLNQVREPAGESPAAVKAAAAAATEDPICLEARLPPLHPKRCSCLLLLAAGHGSLFAGPSSQGGLLQWGRPEGNIRRPEFDARTLSEDIVVSERSFAALNEDPDVAPASEVFVSEAKQVTCVHVDDVSKVLWVGHADGKISGFALGPSAGAPINTRRIHYWQAFRHGKILTICTTPWGDLWAGSSKGYIRIWRIRVGVGGGGGISPPRELRRQGGARPSSNAIHFLTVAQSGQVVWSGSNKTLQIWEASSGMFLGHVQRGADSEVDRDAARRLVENSERDPRFIPRLSINLMKGLGIDTHSGRITSRTYASQTDALISDQQMWAVQTDKKHAAEWVENVGVLGGKAIDKTGKAALHAGKFIGKLVRNKRRGEGSAMPSAELRGLRDLGVGGVHGRMSFEGRALAPEPADGGAGGDSDDGGDGDAGERGSGKDGHLRALVSDNANGVWAAWQSGKLERYAFNGQWKATKDMGSGICCVAVVGPRLWVGLADGRLRVLADRLPAREWRAHDAGVLQVAAAGSRVYSLAADGSVKGWCSTVPSEYDQVARQALDSAAHTLLEPQKLEIACFSWNVNEQKPAQSAFFGRVGHVAAADAVKLAVFGLQEIEMGGGSVAMAAAKDALHKKAQEKGNTNGQWWAMQLLAALGGPSRWRQFGLRQLSGMLVLVFARTELEDRLGEVSTASVACGVLGVGGNKGAVAVSFTLCRRRFACVCSHFAAHQEAVWARNQNYLAIVKGLTFSNVPWYDLHVYPDEEDHLHRAAHRLLDYVSDSDSATEVQAEQCELELIQGQGMRAAEMLVWAGDFNYRINSSYEEVKDYVRRGKLEQLLARDQCKAEIRQGRIFQNLREGHIRFPPTYKFNKNDPDPLGYDTSEKRRVPAWTDRIFFRGTLRRDIPEDDLLPANLLEGVEGDEQSRLGRAEAITVEAVEYAAGMDVCDSDHKPIWARLLVTLPVTLQEKKRRKCSHLLKDCFLHSVPEPPRMELSANVLSLHPVEERAALLKISNTGTSAVVARIVPLVESWQQAPPDAPREIPDWLDVFPVSVRIAAQASASVWVSLSSREGASSTREKSARLRVQVDHDYAVGGERPEGGELRDRLFTIHCNRKTQL